MTTPARFRISLITPLQWVVAVLMLFIVLGLLWTVARAPERQGTLNDWIAPGATIVASSGSGMTLTYPVPLTNATLWYGQRLAMPPFGGRAIFTYRRPAIFPISRRSQKIGMFVGGAPSNETSRTFLVKQTRQVTLIHLCQPAGTTNTWTQLYQHSANGEQSSISTEPLLAELSYATTTGTSTSSAGDMTFRNMEVPTNLSSIVEWYSARFGLIGPKLPGAPLRDMVATRLPCLAGTETNAVDFQCMGSRAIALIHVEKKRSNSTEVTVSIVTF